MKCIRSGFERVTVGNEMIFVISWVYRGIETFVEREKNDGESRNRSKRR